MLAWRDCTGDFFIGAAAVGQCVRADVPSGNAYAISESPGGVIMK